MFWVEESDKVKIMQSLKHLYNVSPHGLFQTSLKIRQFGEILSCDVFIFSHNTIYLLVQLLLNARKSARLYNNHRTVLDVYTVKRKRSNKSEDQITPRDVKLTVTRVRLWGGSSVRNKARHEKSASGACRLRTEMGRLHWSVRGSR